MGGDGDCGYCPQVRAYHSDADVIGYGGAAGGGKTDLLLGLAGTKHQRALIFRRVFPSVRAMIERSREIFNARRDPHSKDSYNESLHVWRLEDGRRMLEFGSVQFETDLKKYQGQPHDLLGFDEATEFPEHFIRFLMAWNRSTQTDPATGRPQKCRLVLTFNPPLDETGDWVNVFFGPWLDENHPRPAADGEKRWYAMVDGKEIECDDGAPFEHNGETITPKSRTFFHASLKDNPALEVTGYGATIDALPEPLRSLLKGKFGAARQEDPYQVIPRAWVKAAQARWQAEPPALADGRVRPVTTLGIDVARGGKDKTVFAARRGWWFAPLQKFPGHETRDGQVVAALARHYLGQERPRLNVDVIGVGSSAYDQLKGKGVVVGVNFAEAAELQEGEPVTDASGTLVMANTRAWAYWHMRELLDPASGVPVALPPDSEIAGDLCAARWRMRGGRLYIEAKEEIVKRIGRSPDCGDALVLAAFMGAGGLPPSQPQQASRWNEQPPADDWREDNGHGEPARSRWKV